MQKNGEDEANRLVAGEPPDREKGKDEGLTESETRGGTKSLMRFLLKHFGTVPVVAQIAASSIGELERWVDCVLDAPALEAVFRERRGR